MLVRMGFFIFWLAISISGADAATLLPRNLNATDRIRALEILGFGSSAKILDNPYPLGGYSGIELGITSEFIPVDDLANLGSGTPERGEFSFYSITLGKGLYYNIDTHVYFTPFLQNEEYQSYGGQIRWGFYEAGFFPLTLSAVLGGGGANFANLINVTTLGADLVATLNLDNVAIYFGGGTARAIGHFIGGTNGITDDQQSVQHDIVEMHTLFGINVDIAKLFIALQVDRYTDSVYSGKLGVRF